nr:eukaryotic translation initiation factor 1-like [Symphalangus syndactylus]XP_055104678.1 eukaryotic translation initiation factor 1-like [Symphalangus syndactylus]
MAFVPWDSHLQITALHSSRTTERDSISKTELYLLSTIQNLHSFDPSADANNSDDLLPAGTEDCIHIRIQQRKNGRKTLTIVLQEISDDYDKKKLAKVFKKKFACNDTVIEHPEYGEVIQLQSDQCKKNICQILVETGLAKEDHVKGQGFATAPTPSATHDTSRSFFLPT